jgi:hypothetical protein
MRMGAIMSIASVITLFQTVFGRRAGKPFVDRHALRQVLLVLFPAFIFVAAVTFVGLYVSAAVYIATFMMYMGHYRWSVSAAVGLAVVTVLFVMFEIWFLVPLPKGPLEELFGY